MSNSYFRFKEFIIHQEHCANKVSTDACVFGAFVGKYIADKTILDVGCGSGLLSIMLAQAKAQHITGVEIDETCANQAQQNTTDSSYASIIDIVQADIRTYKIAKPFDWIISNPPFFNNTYQNANVIKNKARQTESLSPEDWRMILQQGNCINTKVALLLSNNDVYHDYKTVFHQLGFSVQQTVSLLDKKNAPCKRVILFASKTNQLPQTPTSLIYKKDDNSYTDDFTDLLQAYYLYL